jgi:hypothetical protein
MDRLSGLRIPLPSMPRADQLVPLDRSLPQRTATMQAHVVHGADDSVYIGYAYHLGATGKLLGLAFGGKSGLVGQSDEFGHGDGRIESRPPSSTEQIAERYLGCNVCAIMT